MAGHKDGVVRQPVSGVDAPPQPSPSQGEGAGRRIASVVGGLLLLPLCLCYAWNTLQNYADFWAHAAIGRWIVRHGRPPAHTLFLWTWHGPYIAHSWVSEAITYITIRRLSDDHAADVGLLSAGLFGFLAFAILWRLFDVSSRTVCAAVALFSLAIAAEAARLLPRPEIATMVLLAVLLSILVNRHEFEPTPTPSLKGREREPEGTNLPKILAGTEADDLRADVRLGILLVAMFIAWTNLHGGMATGLIVLWIAAAADVVQDHARSAPHCDNAAQRGRRSVRFIAIAALCTLATLINPYGYHYYSIYTAVSTITFHYIMEWKPMYVLPLMPDSTLYSISLLFAAALYAWIKGTPYSTGAARPRRWAHLIWLLVFFAMTMQARRNVGFLAIVCLAIAAPYFRVWSAGRKSPEQSPDLAPSRRKRQARTKETQQESGTPHGIWPATALVVYMAVLANAYDDMGPKPAPALMPTIASGMTAFVKQNGITGRLFNDYDSSMYLEWRLDGSPGLYVDGNNAYPDQIFADYMNIRNATPQGLRLLDQQGIVCVLGSVRSVSWICRTVAASPRWALAYYGVDGPVWIRRLPQYRPLWDGVPTWQGTTARSYLQYLHTAAHDEAEPPSGGA